MGRKLTKIAIAELIVVDWINKEDVKREMRKRLRRLFLAQNIPRDQAEYIIYCLNYCKTSKTALADNLSLNQISLLGNSVKLTPAFSKFNRSETAKIKLLRSELST